MRTRLSRAAAAVLVSAFLGLGLPLLDLWRDCRTPTSEACVWGRAYLPVTLTLGGAIALVLAVVVYLGLRAWAGRGGSADVHDRQVR